MKKLLMTSVIGLLISSVSEAATYYVAKTGSNSNTCVQAQSSSTPRLTINAGISCLGGGDTLIIKAGTYAELIDPNNTPLIPSGTSGASTVIQAYPGDSVIFQPSAGGSAGDAVWLSSGSQYISFLGMIWDGTNIVNNIFRINGTANHISIQGGEIRNSKGNGVFLQDTTSNNNSIMNVDIHDNGLSEQHHGIYIRSSGNIVEHVKTHNNAGYGIHIYWSGQTPSNNIVRYVTIYANGSSSAAGIVIGQGNNNLVYNSIFYGNKGSRGIQIGFGATNTLIYNNTIYQNAGNGIEIQSGVSGTVVKNNISFNNTSSNISNSGSGTVLAANLTSDPSFANAAANNFSLQAGSAAINNGATIGEVVDDFSGTLRPQGCCYDIGASEYISSVPAPSAPSNLSVRP